MKQVEKVPYTKNYYIMIDGNPTKHPVAYCTRYHGVLTANMMVTHQCEERGCTRLRKGDRFE